MSIPKDSAKRFSPSPTDRQLDGQTVGDRTLASDLPSHGWSYEETVQRVEAIMTQIESGELELADVFDQFAAAVNYLRQCELFLSQRQQQMDLLIETLTDDLE